MKKRSPAIACPECGATSGLSLSETVTTTYQIVRGETGDYLVANDEMVETAYVICTECGADFDCPPELESYIRG